MAEGAPAQIAVEVVVDGGGSSGPGRRTVLQLLWSRHDALAVRLVLTAQPDHPALPRGEWVVLRDFLRYGLTTPTGDGDVRIKPDTARDRVSLELAQHRQNDDRPCLVSLPRATVERFLDATERIVASGDEASGAAVDALIARLLQA